MQLCLNFTQYNIFQCKTLKRNCFKISLMKCFMEQVTGTPNQENVFKVGDETGKNMGTLIYHKHVIIP